MNASSEFVNKEVVLGITDRPSLTEFLFLFFREMIKCLNAGH